ncbi:hypothetical protein ASD50_07600 [Mesorhizobium sp. Root552]|uniref:hypothetical protein n=1 Tax=Mesorhizobium sp. Root552 TaxID=1736555 RepID=UPI0007023A5B|nr:hypothetical protein [Mesorhizobium sp. Root552]KQZ19340.1 hypothetical protein ASD50_07600 [Mesorhizobium sp. Root552]
MAKVTPEPEVRPAGTRIDGGKRRDLNKERVSGRMSGVVKPALTPAQREASKAARRKADKKAKQNIDRLVRDDGGKGGSVVSKVKVKISSDRTAQQTIRCRPGTFEWRYGRNKQSVFFHAGNHFAVLWERAGIAVASSADFLRGTASGYPTGIGDGRVAAIDALRGSVEKLGQFSFDRLMMYCVQGKTAAEIARLEMMTDREIATVLASDLRQCAIHFKYLGIARGKIRSTSETN